jgi:N-acetylglucosaminyldiphosphoundecaprenol N-acetyl-beta-D-mannosaminyltransferase
MTLPSPGQPRDREVLIGSLQIHDVSFDETTRRIISWARDRVGGYVCTPNVDYVVRSRRDEDFRRAISGARLRVPDGMWIIYASRIAGRRLHGTVTGRLLVPAAAKEAATEGLVLALLGAGPGVAQEAKRRLESQYPGLTISAAVTPPTPFVVGSAEDTSIVNDIRSANAHIIFVALGAPKQELWMRAHEDEVGGAVMVGVGAAFDIISGRFREAPSWMTRFGFEWLYRLGQEPKRLARRYLVDDPWILFWAARTRLARPPR